MIRDEDCPKCEGTGVIEHFDSIEDIEPMETESCAKCGGTGVVTVLVVEKGSLVWRMLAGVVPGIPKSEATAGLKR